ncbi:MAG TPA: DUF4097 family beta strand repeat-containing protein [candidate division Zixibacteria bacterium]|nr:DUF4097 family beta strand repeat-containing protein [candidate division Zixibacteria bacterium]
MNLIRIIVSGLTFVLSVVSVVMAADIEKTFPAKETVNVNTVSGDCRIEVWDKNEIRVEIVDQMRPADSWEPVFRELSSSIKMTEEHYESNRGRIIWTIYVPQGTEVRFSTASGDMEIRNLKGDVDIETASGDIAMYGCKGEVDINTASGDINIEEITGRLDVSTASGDIDITGLSGLTDISTASGDIDIEDARLSESSSFSTASGDVIVSLAEKPTGDIEVSTASGNAAIECNGHELTGTVEMYAHYRSGDIDTDFDLGKKRVIRRDGDKWKFLTGVLGSEDPLIVISTASGRAELNK